MSISTQQTQLSKLVVLRFCYYALIAIPIITLVLFTIETKQQESLPLKTETLILELQHKFGSSQEEFKPRGSILVRPKTEYRASSASILNSVELSESDFDQLQKASASDDTYYLRTTVRKKGDKSEPIKTTQTVIRACALLTSNLTDVITVNLNPLNDFISVNLYTSNPNCIKELIPEPIDQKFLRKFNTTVIIDSGTLGTGPDTATYIKRLEEERQSKLKEGKEDNRSFFAKYWIYIVPAVVILMMMGGPEQGAR